MELLIYLDFLMLKTKNATNSNSKAKTDNRQPL